MKASSVIQLVVSNVILVALILAVLQDYAYRLSYWRSLGFTPTTTYSFLTFITSATNGSTRIPGQLTLDWVQVFVILLVVIDASFFYSAIRDRLRASRPSGPIQGAEAPAGAVVPA
jgi:hypothetical protein